MSFDFREYIQKFNPKAQQMNSDQVSINCVNPDCDDNWRGKRKMTVNLIEGKAFCFKCNSKYDMIEFVAQVENISRFQAMQIVKASDPIRTYGADRLAAAVETLTAPAAAVDPPAPAAIRLEPCKLPPLRRIEPGTQEMAYLEGRKFGKEEIDHFGLFFSPFGPPTGTLCRECPIRAAGKRCCPWFGRIIIPIYKEGVAISFQGRSIIGAEPKYLFPAGFGNELYNWDDAKYFGTIIVTEGVTSAWRVYRRGYHNVTATFGKSLKPSQEKTIRNEPRVKKVIMLWDGGTLPEAYEAGLRLAKDKEVLIAMLPGKMDPDECPDTPDYIEAATPIEKFDKLTVAMSKLAQ